MSSQSKRVLQISPPSLLVHLFSFSCPFSPPLSIFLTLFRLPNSSRSPHLIRLLAFSRMKELQRPHGDTYKYYLGAVTNQDDISRPFSLG